MIYKFIEFVDLKNPQEYLEQLRKQPNTISWIAGVQPKLYMIVSGYTEGEVADFCAFSLGMPGNKVIRNIDHFVVNHREMIKLE